MSLVLSGDSPSLSSYQGGALTSGTAQASTSGTSIDFTSIPSWVKRVTVMFNGVSTNGTSTPLIQLGSGSPTTTGYSAASTIFSTSVVSTSTYTTGFGQGLGTANWARNGSIVFSNQSGNIWVAQGSISSPANSYNCLQSGLIALSGVLDRIRVTTVNGTDTFNAGSINIIYE
jgi:hypothetical protein